MKFTLSWLKEFLEIDPSIKTENELEVISTTLSKIGLEVEEIMDRSAELKVFEVAEIIEAIPHPNADKLRVCTVATKAGNLQIVCGAPNARHGIKVVLAPIGVTIPNGKFTIKQAKIRDVESNGMLCSSEELFLKCGSEGIIELPNEAIVGDSFIKYCGLDDPAIEVSVTPNRGDCLGVYGIARDLAAAGLGELRAVAWPEVKTSFPIDTKVTLESTKDCPAFAFCEIRGLTNGKSPEWLKHRLENIGLTPISAIVDVTNYICYSFGRPMHAYDRDKLSGNLQVNRAKKNEQFDALSDKNYKLSEEDLVIRDDSAVQSLAGIIGGKISACSNDTKSIVLEAAIFDKDLLALSGRKLGIETDARFRLERLTDPAILLPSMQMAAKIILDICGGEVSNIVLAGSVEAPVKSVFIDESTIVKATGVNISIKDSGQILEKLGFRVSYSGSSLTATVPSWRHDIAIKEDLIEEIVRIYGFDKIPEVQISSTLKFRLAPVSVSKANIARRVMAGNGFDELITWSFMNSKNACHFSEIKEELRLRNPISSELDYMRPSILPNLLEAVEKNIARSIGDGAFFEVGPIFLGTNLEDEKLCVSAIRFGNIDANLHSGFREADIFDIKADVESVMNELGLPLDKTKLVTDNLPSYFHPTRSTGIVLGKNIIGYFGEIHPLILKKYKIEKRVVALEINISAIPQQRLKYGRRDNFIACNYQPVSRDFAFMLDKDIPAGDLAQHIESVDKDLIRNVEIFDLYIGDKIPDGKKSVAIRVIVQANDRTLSEEELTQVQKNIIATAAQKMGAALR